MHIHSCPCFIVAPVLPNVMRDARTICIKLSKEETRIAKKNLLGNTPARARSARRAMMRAAS
jgi:hypothetical protein